MEILGLPERKLKRGLEKYALEYVKNNSYYNSRIVITNFLLSHLRLSPKQKNILLFYRARKHICNDYFNFF